MDRVESRQRKLGASSEYTASRNPGRLGVPEAKGREFVDYIPNAVRGQVRSGPVD